MRDYVLCYVNGQRHEIRGQRAFMSLSEFLRTELQLTGTKVVCAEGDCGACTVLVGRPTDDGLHYEAVDACIQFLYQLDGKHIVSVEGLAIGPALHPVQEAMAQCHGSQCGYCTPGFVMALAGGLEDTTRDARTKLTGNLCRCTGYVPILEAAASVARTAAAALTKRFPAPSIAHALRDGAHEPLLVDCRPRSMFFAARTLEQALDFKARHPEAVIVAGGTELGVLRNKRNSEPPALLSLLNIPGLDDVACVGDSLSVGANVTWTQVEAFAKRSLPELHRMIVRFGSPQIRNVATLAGNVAHGSPIADSLPFLYVMEAELELVSQRGPRRVRIDDFYKGYKVKDLAPDEIITHIRLPLPVTDEYLKLYKVSRRNDLDIATFGAAVRVRRSGELITGAFVAYAGVGPTVVRLPKTEAFLQGKHFTDATFQAAGAVAAGEVRPINDVRGTRDYRLTLAENILLKFWLDCEEPDDALVGPGTSA